MFTPEYRTHLRSDLLEFAARDKRLSAAAITGSTAEGREDQWSDIDLAFGVTEPENVNAVLSDFTTLMYERHCAIHHHDVRRGDWIYRVFFLPGTLQVDLAFVNQANFRPGGPAFRLVFGDAHPLEAFPKPPAREIIGLAWLHALHARSCIARGKFWQAEYMIHATREYAMTLACLRHDLPAAYGRGIDALPGDVTAKLHGALVRELSSGELWRSLRIVVDALVTEICEADAELSGRIAESVRQITEEEARHGNESVS